MQINDFIKEINNNVNSSEEKLNQLEVGVIIELVEMSHPLPVSSDFISFNIGEMMAREEQASQRCHGLGNL